MVVFDIFEHPRWGHVAVPQGFCWPAFLAPSVWAAAVGMGTVTMALVVASTVMFKLLKLTAVALPDPWIMLAVFTVAYLAFGFRPGLDANHWRARKLRREGYRWKYAIAARGRGEALRAVRQGRATLSERLLLAADDALIA